MKDNEVNMWAIKLATLEILAKSLYVEFFRRQPDPVASANSHAELYRQRAAEKPPLSLSQHEALALEEDMNVFLDELVNTLRRLE